MFKAKIFPTAKPITDLFNESILPYILEIILGKPAEGGFRAHSGQIALRFPGDYCKKDTADYDHQAFEVLRKHWHIDGCPNNFIPGITDHWGTVKNFDALCGILLNTTEAPMSGELCVYPGSHHMLAEFFQREGLTEVFQQGTLPVGNRSDAAVGDRPVHCIGNKGDAFICNYMLAHFIAPNTCPNIRYATYFRMRGPGFNGELACKESMLDPLLHWRLDGRPAEATEARSRRRPGRPKLKKKSTFMDLEQEKKQADYYDIASNDHTIPDVSHILNR